MEEKNLEREAFLEMQKKSQKMRKKLLLILGGVALAAILLCAVVLLLDGPGKEKKDPAGSLKTEYSDLSFYEPYQGNIMENPDYLELDRKVYYSDGSGMESSIEDDNLNEFSREVIFLYNYLQTIVAGDAEAYNACFNNGNYRKESFHPQMLYGARITYYSRSNDEQGVLITYKLEYMIHRNDGSFRRDIRSDESRAQYLTLRIEPAIAIEKLITHYEIVEKPVE